MVVVVTDLVTDVATDVVTDVVTDVGGDVATDVVTDLVTDVTDVGGDVVTDVVEDLGGIIKFISLILGFLYLVLFRGLWLLDRKFILWRVMGEGKDFGRFPYTQLRLNFSYCYMCWY